MQAIVYDHDMCIKKSKDETSACMAGPALADPWGTLGERSPEAGPVVGLCVDLTCFVGRNVINVDNALYCWPSVRYLGMMLDVRYVCSPSATSTRSGQRRRG